MLCYTPMGTHKDEQLQQENYQATQVPLKLSPLKLILSFNPVGPFQLASMFSSIEQDLYKKI